MEALRKYIVDILKDKREDKRPPGFGCKTFHIWQKGARTLKAQMDKALQSKITFAIDTSKYDIPYHNTYRRYNYFEKSSNGKITSSHNVYCHYCCMKGHTIAKCNFRRLFVSKGAYQWLPKCHHSFTNH